MNKQAETALNILMEELTGIINAWDKDPNGQLGVARINDARIAVAKVGAMAMGLPVPMTLDEAEAIESAKRTALHDAWMAARSSRQ
jgi:hypothetical protein